MLDQQTPAYLVVLPRRVFTLAGSSVPRIIFEEYVRKPSIGDAYPERKPATIPPSTAQIASTVDLRQRAWPANLALVRRRAFNPPRAWLALRVGFSEKTHRNKLRYTTKHAIGECTTVSGLRTVVEVMGNRPYLTGVFLRPFLMPAPGPCGWSGRSNVPHSSEAQGERR